MDAELRRWLQINDTLVGFLTEEYTCRESLYDRENGHAFRSRLLEWAKANGDTKTAAWSSKMVTQQLRHFGITAQRTMKARFYVINWRVSMPIMLKLAELAT